MVQNGRNWSHDPYKNLRGCGETETQDLELKHPAERYKAMVFPALLMDRDLKVGILQAYGKHPIVSLNVTDN